MDKDEFYWKAVGRNIGLTSREEQEQLRASRVAVAGLGGLGSGYLLNLTRMGIGHFNIADFDEYSVSNINRQLGATSKTADRSKVEVMVEFATDIHPGVEFRTYTNGVQPDNVHEFLGDADIVVDAIDFFSMKARLLLYRTARELGKTVLFSAPLGHSGTLHAFTPDGMSFEDYYDIRDDMSPFDKLVNFAVGLTPAATHRPYMDMSKVNFADKAGPSLASACAISVGLVTSELLVVLLKRRAPQAAPRYVQFDPYRQKYAHGRLIWGNRGPLQRLKRWYVARQFRDQAHIINAM